jgi:ferritin heavy chain
LHLLPQALLEVHSTASKHDDAQMTDFLEGTFLKEQVEAIKHLGDLITKMKRVGDGVGLHIIDKELSS